MGIDSFRCDNYLNEESTRPVLLLINRIEMHELRLEPR